MTKGRLSRDELQGLLALEAKGAARSLREDPDELQHLEPEDRPSSSLLLLDRVSDLPLEPRFIDKAPDSGSPSTEPPAPSSRTDLLAGRARSRRGRIDLAALLYEIAPHCRIAIEPGSGTEVVGHENDLRRALQLMLLQEPAEGSHPSSHSAEIKRDGEWIRVSIDLGPDINVVNETERRWLHRVAIRHGGRFELKGSAQCLLLPADSTGQAEVEALQRELEQAQLLGETYARELASALGPDSERAALLPQINTGRELGALATLLDFTLRELGSVAPGARSALPLSRLQRALRAQGTSAAKKVDLEAAEQAVSELLRHWGLNHSGDTDANSRR